MDNSPAAANPGLAFLVCLVWYATVVPAYLWYSGSFSDITPEECSGWCMSPRTDMLMFGGAYGLPVLFGALLVSVVLLVLLTRTRIGSVLLMGSLAASPALAVLMLIAFGVLSRPAGS